jgi:hypothetical protein
MSALEKIRQKGFVVSLAIRVSPFGELTEAQKGYIAKYRDNIIGGLFSEWQTEREVIASQVGNVAKWLDGVKESDRLITRLIPPAGCEWLIEFLQDGDRKNFDTLKGLPFDRWHAAMESMREGRT